MTNTITQWEHRDYQISADNNNRITGYAIVYSSPSLTLSPGNYVEYILPGACTETLKNNPDIFCLYAHDTSKVLASTKAKTLRIWEDEKGVKFQADLVNNSWGNDVLQSIKRKDTTGMSFGFKVPTGYETWTRENNQIVRKIEKLTLGEISITAFPAYPSSSVSLERTLSKDATAIYKRLQEIEYDIRLDNIQSQIENINAAIDKQMKNRKTLTKEQAITRVLELEKELATKGIII
jgi:HK97 family phage prohead protease